MSFRLPAAILGFCLGVTPCASEAKDSACRVEMPTQDAALEFAASDLKRLLRDVPLTVRFRFSADLPRQAWRYEIGGNGELTVFGRNGASVAYGVFSLLEKELGIAWFAPDCEFVPPDFAERARKLLIGPARSRSGRPRILGLRTMFVAKDYINGGWRFRNKENGRESGFETGFRIGAPSQVHTFGFYAGKLRAAHPELFNAGRLNAVGKPCQTLCLSDETTRAFVAEEIGRTIEADRAKRKGVPLSEMPNIYELSQDDGGSEQECMCENCRRAYEAAGKRYSAPMIAFVSAVADRVHRKYPEVRIRTLAYSYTDLPPQNDVRASKNVIVRYCRSHFLSPNELVPGSQNGKLLEEWRQHASYFSIWSYWRSYSGKLFPAVLTRTRLGAELRFCAEAGAVEYFAENENPMSHAFAMLHHWLFLKLADDPDQDVMALSDRFLKGYYGAAAEPMTRYLEWLETHQKFPTDGFLTPEFYRRVNDWFDEAERLAKGDATALRHIHWERVIVDRSLYLRFLELQKAGYAFDREALSRRFAANSLELVENWGPVSEGVEKRIEATKLEADFYRRYPIPLPEVFRGRDVIPLECIEMKRHADAGVIVEDPDAVAGLAYYVPTGDVTLPFTFGCYSNMSRLTRSKTFKTMDDIPQDEKFHLYNLGKNISHGLYIWLDKTWANRFYAPNLGIVPEEVEAWVSVKFQGPAFVRGSTKENRVLFDRAFDVRGVKGISEE